MNPLTDASRSIRMGELAVANGDGVLRTLLGSCIGLVLYDRPRRIGGLAHIVLPESRGLDEPPAKYVDTAIPALLEAMRDLGARPQRTTARMAGGANMFGTKVTETVGERNIEACETLLAQMRIPIEGRHCGGKTGRRMRLDTASGVVTIEMVGAEPVEL